MKQYVSLPIEKLVSDVAVDEAHVRELEDSIMVAGHLSPVLVREDSLEIIDGFHRVAAMKELGFSHMECVLVSCDDEFFWDSRIMSAVLHRNVTFARAVEWIEQAFSTSQIASKHSNVGAAVQATYKGTADADVSEWIESKSKKWGLKPVTMKDLLYTKQVLSPKLYAQAKSGGDVVTSSHYKEIAKALPDKPEVQEAVAYKVTAEELSVRETTSVLKALRSAADEQERESILRQPVSRTTDQMVREAKIEKLLSQPRKQVDVPLPEGKYRTIVIDPPWPIEKILREVRPNQLDLDYPTMTLEEIEALPVPELAYEDGCHIYLWTTHKYLPRALQVLDAWGANYECLLTWVKNVGITPFSWMYSTEHCLFARIGNLPLLKLGKRLDFQAKVREHSRKPEEFYNLIKEVSPEPRIDMFSREKREGFAQYGNELDRFSSKQVSVID